MFIKSAASDTLQGKAIQHINEKWGEGKWNGTETIGIPVCKKKYAPFCFSVTEDGSRKRVQVERMFGCRSHSELRREKIETCGLRPGWEPFGLWSMRKAQELARRETDRINGGGSGVGGCAAATASSSSSSSDDDHHHDDPPTTDEEEATTSDEELKTICHNGKCAWRLREKYDNIYREVTGISDSDDE